MSSALVVVVWWIVGVCHPCPTFSLLFPNHFKNTGGIGIGFHFRGINFMLVEVSIETVAWFLGNSPGTIQLLEF